MKLEARSKRLLGLSKASAKLIELNVRSEMHPPLADSPTDLLILTIGILGRLSSLVAKGQEDEEFFVLKGQLIDVAQYFDALDNSELLQEVSVYLKVVGAAAYYLADMPGSSAVLAKALPYDFELTPSRLEGVLIWILKSDHTHVWFHLAGSYVDICSRELVSKLHGFYQGSESEAVVWSAANALRAIVYESGSDRDLLFADVICALVKLKTRNSSRSCLPRYSGLSADIWESTLVRPSFMRELWPAQRLMGELGILNGVSAVVQMPTSAGKSRAMELVVRSALLAERAKLIVIVAPFRALCTEISGNFRSAFISDGVLINELPDLNQITEMDSEFLRFILGDKYKDRSKGSILISTPEKLAYLLRHEEGLSAKIDLLLFDEGHQFDTGKRGVTYELLISYLRETVSPDAQKVMISAVMANAKSIGDWLNSESGINIQGAKLIPTVRALGFVNWPEGASEGGIQFYDQRMLEADRFFVPSLLSRFSIPKGRGKLRLFPDPNNSREVASYLAVSFNAFGGAAIFCGTKVVVKSVCRDLVGIVSNGDKVNSPITYCDVDEVGKLHYLSRLHLGDCDYSQAISLGIMPHSSNIPSGIRSSIEWALAHRKASLVICTSTLAQGVNLPIRYLLVTSTFQAGSEISNRDFQNLMGRAGRSGYFTEGNVIFTDRRIFDDRRTKQGSVKWSRVHRLIDFDRAESCLSSLKGLIDAFPSPAHNIEPLVFLDEPDAYIEAAIELAKNETNKYLKKDIEAVVYEMRSRVERFRALESYIIASLADGQDIDEHDIEVLVSGTLAFSLSSEPEKADLSSLFVMAYNKIRRLDVSMLRAYSRSLLGVDQLLSVEGWLRLNDFELGLVESTEDALKAVWPLIMDLSPNSVVQKYMPEELSLKMSLAWSNGASYKEILDLAKASQGYYRAGKQKRTVTIDHVVDYADKFLGYEAMLLVGGVADILDAKNEHADCVALLRQLQGRLKYGLATEFEISLCANGYPDREVVKVIASALQTKFPRRTLNWQHVIDSADEVDDVLKSFPSVFSQ